MVFSTDKRWLLIALFSLVVGGFGASGCLLDPLKAEGLPCGKKGECSSGLKCYLVPGYGSFCLSKGGKFEPFVYRDAGAEEKPQESVAEKRAEAIVPEQQEQVQENNAEKSGGDAPVVETPPKETLPVETK